MQYLEICPLHPWIHPVPAGEPVSTQADMRISQAHTKPTLILATSCCSGVPRIWLLCAGTTILPTSVTLTALSTPPVSSSTIATELTPSSLMSRIASSTLSPAFAATTEEYRCSDGSESDVSGTDRKRCSVGVRCA